MEENFGYITKSEIITLENQKLIDEMRRDWMSFKRNRGKKKYEYKAGNGWITMLKRESMLNFIFDMLGKYEENIV